MALDSSPPFDPGPGLSPWAPGHRSRVPRTGVGHLDKEICNLAIRIQLRENEPIDKALRKLKRLCANEGVYSGFKARRFYEKPSERRRRKAKERMKVIRIAQRLRSQMH